MRDTSFGDRLVTDVTQPTIVVEPPPKCIRMPCPLGKGVETMVNISILVSLMFTLRVGVIEVKRNIEKTTTSRDKSTIIDQNLEFTTAEQRTEDGGSFTYKYVVITLMVVLLLFSLLSGILIWRRKSNNHSWKDVHQKYYQSDIPGDNATNTVFLASFPLPSVDAGKHVQTLVDMFSNKQLDILYLESHDLNLLNSIDNELQRCSHVILAVTNRLLDLWTGSSVETDGAYDLPILYLLKQLENVNKKPLHIADLTTKPENKMQLRDKLRERGITICFDPISREVDFSNLLSLFQSKENIPVHV